MYFVKWEELCVPYVVRWEELLVLLPCSMGGTKQYMLFTWFGGATMYILCAAWRVIRKRRLCLAKCSLIEGGSQRTLQGSFTWCAKHDRYITHVTWFMTFQEMDNVLFAL